MHQLSKLESELVANYIDEYLQELEYQYSNLREVYDSYNFDPDNEICVIESAMEMIRRKIEKVRSARNMDELKAHVHVKKITKDALNAGGNYYDR